MMARSGPGGRAAGVCRPGTDSAPAWHRTGLPTIIGALIMTQALLLPVFVIATCGLVYEPWAATLASYLLGDSVTQFSTVIGTYLFSMGIGSFLSRYIGRGLVAKFVQVELAVGLVGGLSSAVLFLAFSYYSSFRLVLYLLVMV